MTNRDVIDKMTNEELGRFLDHIDCANCAYHENYGEVVPDICNGLKHCAEGIAKWLDQEPDIAPWSVSDKTKNSCYTVTEFVKEAKE